MGLPKKLWTEAEDALILTMRSKGASWDAITAKLDPVTRWTVIQRGNAIGAALPEPEEVEEEDPNREPYPAGHPVTWGLITEGTCLEGTPYPHAPWRFIARGRQFISTGEQNGIS